MAARKKNSSETTETREIEVEVMESRETSLIVPTENQPQIDVTGQSESGVYALGGMSDAEFDARLELMQRAEDRIRIIFEQALTKGETEEFDLMILPGIPKPFLTQNGSNRVKQILGLVAVPDQMQISGDGKSEALRVLVPVNIHIGSSKGPCMGRAWGVASSWEPKWRYRTALRVCPECSSENIRESNTSQQWYKEHEHFYCWKKKGGCGSKFPINDERLVSQTEGQKDIDDPEELIETLARIAEKRADVAVVRRFSGISRWVNIDPDAPGFKKRIREATPTEQSPSNAPSNAGGVSVEEPSTSKQGNGNVSWQPTEKLLGFLTDLLDSPCFARDKEKVSGAYRKFLDDNMNMRAWWGAVTRLRIEIKKRTGKEPVVPPAVAKMALAELSDEQ